MASHSALCNCLLREREKKGLVFGGTACTRVLHYVLKSREVEEQRERGGGG